MHCGKTLGAPLRALCAEPGSLLMLGVAALWSLTSSFDKMVRHMRPSKRKMNTVNSILVIRR
jgi:hypothetical protein